jgi:CBS domain-containing protein
MQVHEIMTRNVHIASPDQNIQRAAKAMEELDVGVLPVGKDDRLVGMITDRDIAVRAVAAGLSPDTPIREIMTPELEYCFEDDELDSIAEQMSIAQVRRLPVIDRNKRLVGILALCDLVRHDARQPVTEALSGISQPNGG